MKRIFFAVVLLFSLSGCTCLLLTRQSCIEREYGALAIRLSEASSQVYYYYMEKNEPVPADFDADQFIKILRQMPPYQIKPEDVDLIASYPIKARLLGGAFSVMLCDKERNKIMEDFAGTADGRCVFDLSRVELLSWRNSESCEFESNWEKACTALSPTTTSMPLRSIR